MATSMGFGSAGVNADNIKVCARCGLRYDWRKSASTTLKMTYCGSLCEKADLGFTIDALIHIERGQRPPIVKLPVVDVDEHEADEQTAAPAI